MRRRWAGVSLSRSFEGTISIPSLSLLHAMKTTRTLLLPLLFLAGASLAEAQGVGSRMPEVGLEGYSQTKADSFEDFQGRAVLIEFFAYW